MNRTKTSTNILWTEMYKDIPAGSAATVSSWKQCFRKLSFAQIWKI